MARVTNLAEAGFLTDELNGLGIEAHIHQLEEFSALSDCWAASYLIRVPTSMASDAAARIRQYSNDDPSEQPAEPARFNPAMGGQPLDLLLWRPVALVVLAGVASFALGHQFSDHQERNAQRRASRNSLSAALGEIGQPLVTEPAAGRPRHRLSYDRRREAWFLDVDRNGDGRYESRRAFHTSGAAW